MDLLYFVSAADGVLGVAVIGVTVFAVRGIVQRLTYSRETLLEVLVERERGIPIPDVYYNKMKPADFYKR
jgi:hypothetical protein